MSPTQWGFGGVTLRNFQNLYTKGCIFLHFTPKFFENLEVKLHFLGFIDITFGVSKELKNLQKGIFVQILNMKFSKGGGDPHVPKSRSATAVLYALTFSMVQNGCNHHQNWPRSSYYTSHTEPSSCLHRKPSSLVPLVQKWLVCLLDEVLLTWTSTFCLQPC